MKNFYAKTSRWESPFLIQAPQALESGDVVIAETESGMTSAIIEKEAPSRRKEDTGQNLATAKYIRKANLVDLKNIRGHQKKEQEEQIFPAFIPDNFYLIPPLDSFCYNFIVGKTSIFGKRGEEEAEKYYRP